MYKDKHLQQEANRKASQRRRDKAKGMTEGMINQGMTENDPGTSVIPDLELCRTCQVKLPPLEQPREYPGMCIMCVTKKHGLKQQVSSQAVEAIA